MTANHAAAASEPSLAAFPPADVPADESPTQTVPSSAEAMGAQAASEDSAAQESALAEDASAGAQAEANPPAGDPFAERRAELRRLVAATDRVPPAVRRRLDTAIDRAAWNEAGQEQPALAISEILAWLEQSLPRQFALDRERLEASEHPGGDVFFSSQADSLNEQQAARIAAEQLAATGFAPRS